LLVALILFLGAIPVYYRLIGAARPESPHTDHIHHILLAGRIAQTGKWPGRPLYHFLVLVFSGWKPGPALMVAGIVVMALAAAGRGYLSALFLSEWPRSGDCHDHAEDIAPGKEEPAGKSAASGGRRLHWIAVTLACVALSLAMPLPNWWNDLRARYKPEVATFGKEMPERWWDVPSIYSGQVSPNAWHSPTASISMPFNLLLFLLAMRAMRWPTLRNAGLVGAAMVLSVLGKPNYVMAFAPCFGIAWLASLAGEIRAKRLETGNAVALILVAFVPVSVVLWWQFSAVEAEAGDPTKLALGPFVVWRTYSKNIPASILLGIAFPLVASVLFPREVARDRAMLLAWATLAVAIIQYALISASNPVGAVPGGWGMDYAGQVACGIFGWGMIFANQILFVTTCAFLLARPAGGRRAAAFCVLGLHAASGAFCLARCLYIPTLAGLF
jgi:hypothetical protein